MTKPTIAAIIVSLAAVTFALSPWESIQRMPPQIRKNKAINVAIMNITVMIAPIYAPSLVISNIQRTLNCPVAQGLIVVCANAGAAAVAKSPNRPNNINKRDFINLTLSSS